MNKSSLFSTWQITSFDVSANTVKLEKANHKRILLEIDFKVDLEWAEK